MTRDELVKAIYDSCDDWACPDNEYCESIEDGDPRVLCMQCAEKLLKEYEDKIRADVIGMFLNAIKTYDTYGYEVDELGEGNYLVKLNSDNEKDFVPYIHLDDVIKCAEGVLKVQR